jgi:hypothetical protein
MHQHDIPAGVAKRRLNVAETMQSLLCGGCHRIAAEKRRVLRCHLKESHYAKFLFG